MTEYQQGIVKKVKISIAAVIFGVIALIATLFAGPDAGDQRQAVERLCELARTVDVPVDATDLYCTHGGDPILDARVPGTTAAALNPVPPGKLCPGNGLAGRRVQVFYGTPADRASTLPATIKTDIVRWLGQAQRRVNLSHATHTQKIRFRCEDASGPTVKQLQLRPIGDDSSFTFSDAWTSFQDAGYPIGQGTADVFVLFADIGGVYPYCGEGTVGGDPDVAQGGGHLSLIACLGDGVFLHELGHNIGAVPLEAPHSSGGWHCSELGDSMCYNDGASYFANGGQMIDNGCASIPDQRWDCKNDDYWNPDPTVNFAWWNTADSPFFSLAKSKPGGIGG